jgi:hypothetical protein
MKIEQIITNTQGQEKLKRTNGQSDAVNRRSDNTMDKKKMTNNDLQNTTQKTKD